MLRAAPRKAIRMQARPGDSRRPVSCGAAVPGRIGAGRRLGYGSRKIQQQLREEVTMVDLTRRARLIREMEGDFVPDYDAQNMPSADKRAAYALEHLAFRVGRIEQILARIAVAIESALPPKA
jgi:hypothetical protein